MSSENPQAGSGSRKGTVIFIRSDSIGRGNDELGSNLMMNFMHHVSEAENAPDIVIMMNAGVKLVVGDSEVLESLKQLAEKGTEILACGTCLKFFGIEDRQSVGKSSNMAEITDALLGAMRVITV